MKRGYKILILEDMPADAELAKYEIRKVLNDCFFEVVENRDDFIHSLEVFKPDLIISDYQMPAFDGMSALRMSLDWDPVTPFIIFTGSINENTAVECMRAGAANYVIKDHIKRLGPAILSALEQKQIKAEKLLTQEALKFSEERFRRLAENADDLIYRYEFEPVKRFSYVSPASIALTGFTPEEHYRDPGMGFNIVHPDDRPSLEKIGTDETEIRRPIVVRWIRKDKRIIWVELKNVPLYDEAGNLTAIEGIARDITERKKAEDIISRKNSELEFLNNLAIELASLQHDESMPDFLIRKLKELTGSEFVVFSEYDNKTKRLITRGLEFDQKLLAKFIKITGSRIMNSPAPVNLDGDNYTEMVRSIVTEKKSLTEISFGAIPSIIDKAIKGLTGFNRFIGLSYVVSGELYGTSMLGFKATQTSPSTELLKSFSHLVAVSMRRRKAEDELTRAKERAEESDRLKTAFLQNVSHEIRTPLNAIIGFSALLAEPGNSHEMEQYYIDVIFKSNNQLLSIINDILNISYIDAGQEKLEEKDIEINQIFVNLLGQWKSRADEKGLKISYKVPESDPLSEITADEAKLKVVLSNLISNAIKFTHEGSVEFGYKIIDDNILFYVKDTGIGIPHDEQEKIFNRFYQVEKSVSREFGGAGLGLSIAKAYITLMDGEITLKSHPGEGSTFSFRIPLNLPVTVNMRAAVEKIQSKTTRSILVAEDEENNFLLIQAFFSGRDLMISRASNGLEAVDMVKSGNEFDLVIMDIKMPVMDGFEASEKIRELLPGVPIIAQTACANESDLVKALESGCSDYIIKPYSKAAFFSVVDKYLG